MDEILRVGYAVSTDGFDFLRFDKPVFSPKLILEPRGCEDPRIVKIMKFVEERFLMLFLLAVHVRLGTKTNTTLNKNTHNLCFRFERSNRVRFEYSRDYSGFAASAGGNSTILGLSFY